MHTEQGAEIERISSGMMENPLRRSLPEPDITGWSPTNGMDVRSYSEPTSNDIESTFPHELLETPSPIYEELLFPIDPETLEKKCQNTAVSQKLQEDTESDWDTESDSFSIYVRIPLSKEKIRFRKRNSFLKFACGLLFGGSAVLVLCALLVKWIHEFGQRKEDKLIMVCLIFLSLGLWSLFLLFMFLFLVACPTNCDFADDDVV